MSYVKQYSVSKSLRDLSFSLLSRYEPSDILYTIGAAIYDKRSKLALKLGQGGLTSREKSLLRKKDQMLLKALRKIMKTTHELKTLEYSYE